MNVGIFIENIFFSFPISFIYFRIVWWIAFAVCWLPVHVSQIFKLYIIARATFFHGKQPRKKAVRYAKEQREIDGCLEKLLIFSCIINHFSPFCETVFHVPWSWNMRIIQLPTRLVGPSLKGRVLLCCANFYQHFFPRPQMSKVAICSHYRSF